MCSMSNENDVGCASSFLLLVVKVLDLFPSELVAPEVASRSSVPVDGPLEVEILDEQSWPEVEVADDYALQVGVSVS